MSHPPQTPQGLGQAKPDSLSLLGLLFTPMYKTVGFLIRRLLWFGCGLSPKGSRVGGFVPMCQMWEVVEPLGGGA
jgi:hypothetical protein